MKFSDMNWMEVEEYLKKDDRVLLVLGATEQHGYLSVTTDVEIPLALAEAASNQSGVAMAPPLSFGISPYFLAYPGTISLRVSTFLDAVEDMLRSLYGQGFRRFVILNGHGGNDAAKSRIIELENELVGMQVAWYSWWIAPSVMRVAASHGLQSYHAAWIEAFDFIHRKNMPAGGKPAIQPKTLLGAKEVKAVVGDGVYGGPYQADKAVMDEIFAAALADVLDLLNF